MTFSLNIRILNSLPMSEFISANQYWICLKNKKDILGNIQDKHYDESHIFVRCIFLLWKYLNSDAHVCLSVGDNIFFILLWGLGL